MKKYTKKEINKEADRVARELAALMACQLTDNFGDSVVETAKIYKELTGKDLGIKNFENINNRVKQKTNL